MLRFLNRKNNSYELSNRELDKIFERFLSDNKISLKFCSTHNLCKEAIFKIASKIKWFQKEYNYVPNKAYLILSKLSSTERKLVGQF